MDVCDPDAKSTNIRKLIKLHTGRTLSISSEKTCELMRDIRKGNLPLPPLVLTREKDTFWIQNLLSPERIMKLYSNLT